MNRAILPAFAAAVMAAIAALVYPVSAGALGAADKPRSEPALPQGSGGASDASRSPSADELRGVGLSAVKPGTKIMDFELEDLKGKKVKLSGLAGRVVFLNFWATWCPPCRAEMPSMERLHARFADRGLHVLAVDLQEGRREVEGFVAEHKLSFQVVLDRNGSAAAAYGVRSIPTTYVIGRDGTILAGRIGAQEWDSPAVMAFFEKLLAR